MMHGGGVIITVVVWVVYSCEAYDEDYCDVYYDPMPPSPNGSPSSSNNNDGWVYICPPPPPLRLRFPPNPYTYPPAEYYNPSPARSPSNYRIIALVGVSLIIFPLLFTVIYVCKQESSQRQQPILPLLRSAQINIPVGGGGGGIASSRSQKGLDPALVSRLPTVQFSAKALGDKAVVVGGGKDSSCPVCLGEFQDGETVKILPVCLHPFHGECIDMWLFSHVTCPLCRISLVKPAVCLTMLQAEEAAAQPVQ